MGVRIFSRWFLASAFFLAGAFGCVAEDSEARAWVERMARTARDQKQWPEGSFRRVVSYEWLARDGGVRERASREFDCAFGPDGIAATLTRVDGRAPTAKEIKRESGHKKRGRHAPGDASEDEPEWADEKWIGRFEYFLEGFADHQGRRQVVVRFAPKDAETTGSSATKLIAALSGKLYIDAEDAGLSRIEARLSHPVSLGGGWVGRVDHIDAEIAQQRVAKGVWLPGWIRLDASGRRLWNSFRLHVDVSHDAPRVGKTDTTPH
jgi:hypothetical protein